MNRRNRLHGLPSWQELSKRTEKGWHRLLLSF
jgi:hypothetical protein